jgi:nucleoside-diphosphate-sugar epimerase
LIGPVPAFYRRLKSGQTCVCTDAVRDFVGLVDFLNVVELSLETDFIGGINISSGIATSISQVYASVNAALGKIGPVDVDVIQTASDDIKHMVLNPTLAESIFGISFEYDLDRWVNECVTWYEKQAEIEVRSHITSIKNKS